MAALRPPSGTQRRLWLLRRRRQNAGLGVHREQAVDVLHVFDIQRAGGLFQQQAVARDHPTREALLHRLQSLMHERVMHAPLLERAVLYGVGPRVAEPAIGLIPLLTFAAPYEEMRLKRP